MVAEPKNACPSRRSLDRALGYSAIALFVLLSYVAVIGLYERFLSAVLPRGDPFTYTVLWFKFIDWARADYFKTILDIFQGNVGGWYRLMELQVALWSPFLTKNPAVLCIVNYLVWGVATAAFFRLGLSMQLGAGRAFVVALIPWLWPVNYGFSDYASIPVLALDASFTGALMLALATSFTFAFNPRSTANALIAALSVGVAVWGRGNSAPVVALVVVWPWLLATWNAWRAGEKRTWINVVFGAVLALAMTIEFYATYWKAIAGYYSLHAEFVERHHWSIADAMPYLKNIPGFMYWRKEDAGLTMLLSWASHFVPLLALAVGWRGRGFASERRDFCKQLAIAGTIIYFGTYVVNLILWTDPLMNIHNALLIWRPMLIGLSLSLIVLLIRMTDSLRITRDAWMMAPVGALALIWGGVWNAHNTPWDWAQGRPNPQTIERFALGAEPMLEGNGTLSVLWYGGWNFAILRYYRGKNDRPDMPLYMGKHWDDMWSQADYSAQNKERVLEEIKAHFQNAGMVIVPEFLDYYAPVQPYAFYRFKEHWAPWLNSPEAPRMRVRMILEETPNVRLLVLQREELARGRGDPFRLPWGSRPDPSLPDYSDAVIRYK